MPSTYSPDLRIELIGPGEQAGTWNTTTNNNLGTLVEDAISGYVSVSVTSANQALSASNGAVDQARNATIALSTTTSAVFAVYAPPASKQYVIHNTTAYTATIYNSTVLGNTTAAGLGVVVAAGARISVFSDGFDFRAVEAATFSGVLPVVNGGTGVSTSTGTGATVLNTSPTLTSPTLTTPILGTPTSGALDNCTSNTETFGTSNTQLATTAFVQAALQALHPVGSVYINATNGASPASLLGFGTWVAFGAGRVLVGNGGVFAAGSTGGSVDATLPSHTHTATVSDPGHAHGSAVGSGFISNGGGESLAGGGDLPFGRPITTATSTTGITVANSTAGVSASYANLQPYIVVYMWERTA
jgi:uncharacterized UPF0146 family protein